MRLISYDCEVFAYDWLVTLKDKETGVYTCIWNDNEALKMALSDDCIYVGSVLWRSWVQHFNR